VNNAGMRVRLWLLLLSLVASLGSAGTPAAALERKPPAAGAAQTATPIQHFVMVMQQNHTFDNYFGNYPGADGLPPDVCMPIDPSASQSDCVQPFHIGTFTMSDLRHDTDTFAIQYNNGLMDGFVSALQLHNVDGRLAMAYYDGREVGYYWNLADQFVLFDQYFSSAHTGSIMNRMFWVTGSPGSDENNIPEGGYGDLPTIFDRLQERGISWKFYVNNYDPTLNYRVLPSLDHLPPQVQWLPLLNFDRFIDDPALNSHIVDLDQYFVDLENGTLPAVSYVLLLGASEHPMTDIGRGQRLLGRMLSALMLSDAWESSALMVTYDDWGGWYDHVRPPQVDRYGYGFRVPALLVGAYARRGYIDSTRLDHTSALRFIEDNWQIAPLAERDAQANTFISAFDFEQPTRPPVYVSAVRQTEPPRLGLQRASIFVTYGLALAFALVVIAMAALSPRARHASRSADSPD